MKTGRGIGAKTLDASNAGVARHCPSLAALHTPAPRVLARGAPGKYRFGDLLWPNEAARRLMRAHLVVLHRQNDQRL
jgi:hypothetical protein